jgi:hypothetical protein
VHVRPPRVGNREFARVFGQLPIDLVPKLPPHIPMLLDYDHVDSAYSFCSSSFAKNSLVIWHAMETTLQWLDTTSSAQQGG